MPRALPSSPNPGSSSISTNLDPYQLDECSFGPKLETSKARIPFIGPNSYNPNWPPNEIASS